MNDVTVLIYLVCFAAIIGATFAYMWKMMSSTLTQMDKPIKTKIPAPHPEMEGIKTGEELLVFSLEDIEDDEGEDETYIGENI